MTDPEKKGPTQKKLFQFSVKNIFFKFHWKLRALSNVNSVIFKKILENCLYLILLPIVGLYSKPCLNWPLKDIHNKGH